MATQNHTINWEQELAVHREWMRGLAQSRLGNPHEADDVLQDVCLAVVDRSPELRDPAKVRNWLYQLVVRKVADYQRRQYRNRRLVDQYAHTDRAVPYDQGGWDWVLATEQRTLLRVALERLPQADRELILLKFTRNWSYRQLGEHLGMDQRAVEYRLVRAKQALRAQLQQMHGDQE
ncbi:MAG: sigma-70 family RNA polymerase sigma factor [Pirellulales bacterium]|nr:sigma-70 family RNA polymerase sigma factor [Pirellulales bacterium]